MQYFDDKKPTDITGNPKSLYSTKALKETKIDNYVFQSPVNLEYITGGAHQTKNSLDIFQLKITLKIPTISIEN